MNTLLQILVKSALTLSVVLISFASIRSLWNTSIDFKRLVNPFAWFEQGGAQTWSFLPTRGPDKVYLDGNEIATVSGVNIDRKNGVITFQRMVGPQNWTTNKPVPGKPGIPPTFEYLDMLIQYVTVKNMSGIGMDQAYGEATFKIVGTRQLW